MTGVKSVWAAQVFPSAGVLVLEFKPFLTVPVAAHQVRVIDGWSVAVILARPAFVVRALPGAVFVRLPARFGDLGTGDGPGGLPCGIGGFLALTQKVQQANKPNDQGHEDRDIDGWNRGLNARAADHARIVLNSRLRLSYTQV
jgi:hypothetical protein